MRPNFHPRLVNGPFDDPGLYIPFLFEKRAILFDAGDLGRLTAKEILKISHVFVSHAHMDHFVGFDRLLRLFLGRTKTLYLYGPRGFLRHVEGHLAGYTWNLVENYDAPLILAASEIDEKGVRTRRYRCRQRFQDSGEVVTQATDGVILAEPTLSVSAAILDHGIPCLGFTIAERFHVNIQKKRVTELGLDIGPWLAAFKEALYQGCDPHSIFEIAGPGAADGPRRFALGELSGRIALITPGQKVTYIADAAYHPENAAKMVALALGADHLFIEAAFLDKDRHIAARKFHLTARQAGIIAGRAGVKRLTIFHFSPRYSAMAAELYREARAAYAAERRD